MMSEHASQSEVRFKSSVKGWTRTESRSAFSTTALDKQFFAIQKSSNICGGEPRVAGTRITVRTLDVLSRQGEAVDQLATAFQIEPWQVEAALKYAARHREEIDELIRQNEQA